MNTKKYTIKYSKKGIWQYADFYYNDNILIRDTFHPKHCKEEEIVSIEGLSDIQDILEKIKSWAYCNQAEIYLIDDMPLGYKSEEIIQSHRNIFEEFFKKLALDFFKSEILPVIRRKKWKITHSNWGILVLIKKSKGEYVNVETDNKDSILIDVICNTYLGQVLRDYQEINLEKESFYHSDDFQRFLSWIDLEELKKLKLFVKL